MSGCMLFFKRHTSLNSNLYLYFFSTLTINGLMSSDPLNIEIWDEYVYFTNYANFFCIKRIQTPSVTKLVKSGTCCYYASSSVGASGVSSAVSFSSITGNTFTYSSFYFSSSSGTFFSSSSSFSSSDDYSALGLFII